MAVHVAFATAGDHRLRTFALANASSLCCLLFVAAVLGLAIAGGDWQSAVYTLSFWHYYLYWLAFGFGAVPITIFKRDAISMKAVSLSMTGWAYFATPMNLASLAIVAAGFLLNLWGAIALGSDRTYYGYELADLPARRITRFPYSWISHPMLVGNIVAFSGTLINSDFRQRWWPLACAHIAMNLGLLIMEVCIAPRWLVATCFHRRVICGFRFSRSSACAVLLFVIVALGLATGAWWPWKAGTLLSAGVGACVSLYAYGMYRCYAPNLQHPYNGRMSNEG